MEIKKIQNSAIWDDFLTKTGEIAPFAQSLNWGQILASEGKEIEYLAVCEGEEVIAIALIVYEKMFFGLKYAFSPKGPIVSRKLKVESYKVIMNEFIKYLKEKKCVFWRSEPNVDFQLSTFNFQLVKVKDVNPSNTLILNLEKTPEEILATMHSKTRYNIGLAERKNLRAENKSSRGGSAFGGKDIINENIKIFLDLMKKTGDRDNFRLHFENHYREVLNSPNVYQITIYSEKTPVAVGIFFGFKQTFTYLYGASDYEYRNLMAPYLVQNEGIKLGKSLGYKNYDFFGIAQLNKEETGEWVYDEKHQYAGVTRFKLGFGGEYTAFLGTYEIVINKVLYLFVSLVKKIRKISNIKFPSSNLPTGR
ncbi:MAG: peptidoglycan bridge formation glycyltransferase FemA/FemB family protein [Candidatus Magasanikbacteria bacterium]|nr:peptidoglycan bridge formation glycyltransferase FemA/FemB family protein [Candidatus Magasanikbacteria bacterium]